MTVLEEAAAHARDDRLRGVEERFVDGGIGDVDLVDREALGLYVDMEIVAGRSGGDNVEVDRSGEHLAVVVVGVVARDFASAGDREERDLAVSAEEVGELVDSRDIANLLGVDVFSAVEGREDFVVLAVFDSGDNFSCVHGVFLLLRIIIVLRF